jgi:hypothetical protein
VGQADHRSRVTTAPEPRVSPSRVIDEGREAYGLFWEATHDSEAVERFWSREPGLRERFADSLLSLPRPHPALPLSLLATIGVQAATGELEGTYGLQSEADNEHALQGWWRRRQLEIDEWVPEAKRKLTDLPEWHPPPGDSPFAGGRVDWPALELVAEPRPLFVLVRDWDFDLRAVSAPPFDYDELFLFLAAREREIDLNLNLSIWLDEYSLPVSAWTILAAAVRTDTALATLVDQERLDALLRAARTDGGTTTYRPSASISRDFWTTEDELGYDFYADAVVEFVLHSDTKPPLTIGIKAPWGAGKTSLMRMVRQRLDPEPERPLEFRLPNEPIEHRDVLRRIREAPDEAPKELAPALARDEPAVDVSDRRRLTVWFNAWKYQSSEQVWAGLADSIITQVTGRMTIAQRERFWASLNFQRIDRAALRRWIYGALLTRLVGPGLGAVGALAAGAVVSLVSFKAGALTAGIGALPAIVTGTKRYLGFLGEDVAASAPRLVTEPDYRSQLGFFSAVQRDLEHVLGLVATPDRPIVVFVDDLDRCSYKTVSDVIEAINVFLAGDIPNCIFVIGMEPDLVAAQIEVAYEDLFQRLADETDVGENLGWRFLEKMVQLPLALPTPEPDQLNAYVDSILTKKTGDHVLDARRVEELHVQLRDSASSVEDVHSEARRLAHADSDDEHAPLSPEEIRAAELAFSDHLKDDDPKVRELLRRHAVDLSRNPREIKRFVNVFRFYSLIQIRRELRGLPAPRYDQIGKLAVLAVRWPQLLGMLGAAVSGQDARTRLMVLEEGARSGGKAEEAEAAWEAALNEAMLGENVRGQLARNDMRKVLSGDPAVGDASAGFL